MAELLNCIEQVIYPISVDDFLSLGMDSIYSYNGCGVVLRRNKLINKSCRPDITSGY